MGVSLGGSYLTSVRTSAGILLTLVLVTGCDVGDDGTRSARGKVAAGAPRYVAGTLTVAAAAATAPAADDYGDDAGQAKGLTLGEPLSGRLEEPSDTDWFSLDLRAGERYRVNLDCYGAGRVIVIAPNGSELGQGSSSDALEVAPTTTGRHYLRVEAQAGRDLFYGIGVEVIR